MKKWRLKLIYLSVAFIFLSCAKDGEIGLEGAQGIQGISGKDGTIIYSGVSAPTNNIGKTGDFYINLTNGNLFGPKVEQGWGEPISLIGKDGGSGEQGKDGATILSGNGVPNPSIGKMGDFYIDLESLRLFGAKTENDWGEPISLKSEVKHGVNVILIKDIKFIHELDQNPRPYDGISSSQFLYYSKPYDLSHLTDKLLSGVFESYWHFNEPNDYKTQNTDSYNFGDQAWYQMINPNGSFNEGLLQRQYTYKDHIIGLLVRISGVANTQIAFSLTIYVYKPNDSTTENSKAVINEFLNNFTYDVLVKYSPSISFNTVSKNQSTIDLSRYFEIK